MRKCKWIGCLLAVFFCVMMGTSIVYAGGGEKEIEIKTIQEPQVTVEPTIEPTEEPVIQETPQPMIESTEGTPFSQDGNSITRDLLYDAATNKQFITIQTRNGNVFYIVIDYDKPLDENEEQYQTYFLNLVDERDLQDLLKEDMESTPIVCSCTEKCELGAVKAECSLCSQDINNCVGKEAAQTVTPSTEPVMTESQTMVETKESSAIYVVILCLLLLVGGGVFAYLKYRSRKKRAKAPNSLDDYEFADEEEEIESDEMDEEDELDVVVEEEDE